MDIIQWLAEQVDRVIQLVGPQMFYFLLACYVIMVLTVFGL